MIHRQDAYVCRKYFLKSKEASLELRKMLGGEVALQKSITFLDTSTKQKETETAFAIVGKL